MTVDLEWATVVGNRVNCTGTCWSSVSVPLGQASRRRGRLSERVDHDSRRARRLARRPRHPERPGEGRGALLRQPQLRLDHQGREGGAAVHDPPEGRRLDADRQHARGHLRQQLHRLRLRLQQPGRRGHEPRCLGCPWDAPDRHLPDALHPAARVPVPAARDDAAPELQPGRARACARVQAAGASGWRSPSSSSDAVSTREGRPDALLSQSLGGRGDAATPARRASRAGSHQFQRPRIAISDGTSTHPHERRVDEDGERQADAELLEPRRRARRRSPRTPRP